jgi:hypothetical protein
MVSRRFEHASEKRKGERGQSRPGHQRAVDTLPIVRASLP